jgi:hypothetical protein
MNPGERGGLYFGGLQRMESAMDTVTSKDGSRIAYDRFGSGPAVILVGGALSYRKFKKMEELAKLLAGACTVIT